VSKPEDFVPQSLSNLLIKVFINNIFIRITFGSETSSTPFPGNKTPQNVVWKIRQQ